VYVWNGVRYRGLANYRTATHQDIGSTYRWCRQTSSRSAG